MTITPQALDDIIGHAEALIWAVRRDPEASYYTDMAADAFEELLVKFGLVKPRTPQPCLIGSRPDMVLEEVEF
jgi:hypothetical protein